MLDVMMRTRYLVMLHFNRWLVLDWGEGHNGRYILSRSNAFFFWISTKTYYDCFKCLASGHCGRSGSFVRCGLWLGLYVWGIPRVLVWIEIWAIWRPGQSEVKGSKQRRQV